MNKIFLLLLYLSLFIPGLGESAPKADEVSSKVYIPEFVSTQKATESRQHYYEQLNVLCDARGSKTCCPASVRYMHRRQLLLAPQTGCPDGYRLERLKCKESLEWCEPI